ncbi:hypothetical protein Clacol_005763 [Clathrus columnatus]|uniref:Dipeptidyl aminopeptidase n=1 Tax=Clathrus columnatus TaxID=1419009 RepID=A0AAV5AHV7_9AGAM|nr:hypothetical protein Clacol_005763 [Clathrus columnatus]
MVAKTYQILPQEEPETTHIYTDDVAADVQSSDNAVVFVRPPTYYNDGRFSPPSSVDGDQETLLDKDPASEDVEDSLKYRSPAHRFGPAKSPLGYLILCIVGLTFLVLIIVLFSTFSSTYNPTQGSELRHITLDNIYDGTFATQRRYLNWVSEVGDGVYSTNEHGVIKLIDIKHNTTTELLKFSDVRDKNGRIISSSQWKLSPDLKYILIETDYRKQWRWSGHRNYYIHRLRDHVTYPIASPSIPSEIAYATWSPTGNAVAYVLNNDLYVLPSADEGVSSIRVTFQGNSSLFFGVPDWVYEEEVFSGDHALWWSPDSRRIAFLRSDETEVNDYTFPIYNPSNDPHAVFPYTNAVTMKYPKPGYPNPLVTVHTFDLDRYQKQLSVPTSPPSKFTREITWKGRRDLNDSVIQEVVWVGNTTLLIKEVNRAADEGSVVLCNLETQETDIGARGIVVRKLGKDGEQGDDGWIDSSQNVRPLPESLGLEEGAYLDIIPTKDGYNQIALFNPPNQSGPLWITFGKDEVVDILGIDSSRRRVYYLSATQPGTGRDPYYVTIPDVTQLTSTTVFTPVSIALDSEKGAYYGASLSPFCGYYLLNYNGPGIPWQKLVDVDDTENPTVVTNNSKLANRVKEFYEPTLVYSTIENEGYVNSAPLRGTSNPLFRYGGPGSQTVDRRFSMDWHTYVACTLQYIVVVVDGRGTGFRGRKLRNPVKGDLGFYETRDQIYAARHWASKPYVDSTKIGVWGWSYGGFMAAKVAEADAQVHNLAMSVAPVTSWLLYDTIYTERYMGLPDKNPGGYVNASISDVKPFAHIKYLLAHGTGDDNVHFANTAHLIDMFTAAQIRDYRLRIYTDSDHSIFTRGANREVYQFLTDFLIEHWGRPSDVKPIDHAVI